MAKLAQAFAKYLIHAKIDAKGIIERPDVIGAVFGQTEGLLGTELDLRELQHTGRIGRIEVDLKSNKGKSYGEIIIPSSLDACETALIAASLETIDKIGPCDADVEVSIIDDVRTQKRNYLIERAKDLTQKMMENGISDSQKLTEMIKQSVRSSEIIDYKGLSAGPGIFDSDELIVVEGRADVINLLKNGIRNVIAIEGSKIPDAAVELTKEKVTTAFLDGDRGGELDLKKLLSIADIDYVARAEDGKEVEELTKKQIYKSLRDRVLVNQIAPKKVQDTEHKPEVPDEKVKKFYTSLLDDLIGTRAAYLIDKNLQIMSKVPLSELNEIINDFNNIHAIVFDGKIGQAIVDLALQKKVSQLVAMGYKERVKHGGLNIMTPKEMTA